MSLKSRVAKPINAALRQAGVRLVSARSYDLSAALEADMAVPLRFRIGQLDLPLFAHQFNCGWPYLPKSTERTVELALANWWLDRTDAERMTEIGAVTPYYWPRRVREIVDPTDPHPLVTVRKTLRDVSLAGRSVLSISTFEHIGAGDYGMAKDPSESAAAIDKLFSESPEFVVTFATGYNPDLDAYVLDRAKRPEDVDVRLVARRPSGVGWDEVPAVADELRPYRGRGWAVFVVHRGTGLAPESP